MVPALPLPLVHPPHDVVCPPDLQQHRLLLVAAAEPATAHRRRAARADAVCYVGEGPQHVARAAVCAGAGAVGVDGALEGALRVLEDGAGGGGGLGVFLGLGGQPEDVDVTRFVCLGKRFG